MLQWLLLFAAIGAGGTWLARRYALARDLIDHPGERRSHAVATPRGGGIAIVAALLVAGAALTLRFPLEAPALLVFMTGLVLVAVAGLVDDHRPLSPWLRLLVHAVAALLLALWVAYRAGEAMPGVIAFFACVVLINVWNFMDGINGLAGSQAVLVALFLAVWGSGAWSWLALALAAACGGFLPYNAPRARIFLGDVGSGAIGYAIAATAMIPAGEARVAWPMVLMPVSAFLVDSGMTLLRRVFRKERWWTAHTQHAYQVCARRWGHARVTLAYTAWTVAALAVSFAMQSLPWRFMLAWVCAWYMSAALLWLWLQRRQPLQ